MKQLRFSKLFFLLLALGLFIGTSPASAALYQDTFTATIDDIVNKGGGYNPYGLAESQQFTWSIVYDPLTILSNGVCFFSSKYPTNQISVAIPRSGNSPQIFTQLDDALYNDPIMPGYNPYGEFTVGEPISLFSLGYYTGMLMLPSPYTGAIEVDFNSNEIWFYMGTPGISTTAKFDPGYETYQRQVVPIPGALVLLGSGLAALTILKRRKG
jgi:hypothetical protein